MEQQPPNSGNEQSSPEEQAAAWQQGEAERRGFPWFGEGGQTASEQTADVPVSPWSPERDVLDEAAIARAEAAGTDPVQARQRIEHATDRERYGEALAHGMNAEDAVSAVEGARLIYEQQQAARQAEQPTRPSGDIAADTGGELVPRFSFLLRRADRVTLGDVLREERLGEVRVAWISDGGYDEVRHSQMVQLYLTAHDGAWAERSLPLGVRVTARVPDLEDASAIERALDRARYHRTELDQQDARRIAAHLQYGPGTGLYRFAVTGEVSDRAMEELAGAVQVGRPFLRRWARSLQTYCIHREDWGPLPGLEDRQW